MKTIVANLESLSFLLDSISSISELEPAESDYLASLISELREHQGRLLTEYRNSVALEAGHENGAPVCATSSSFAATVSADYAHREEILPVEEYFDRSFAEISSAHFDEAKCILLDALEYYPEDEDLLSNLALCHWELGEIEECAERYHEAMAASCPDGYTCHEWALYPEHTFLRSMEGRALALSRLGERREAIELFETLYSLNPARYVGCIYLAGEGLHLLGEPEEALKAYELSPEEPCVFYNRALAYFQLRRYTEAAQMLIYAFALNPHVASRLLQLPNTRNGIIPGYLGSAEYAEDFLDACAPLWRSSASRHFLEQVFSHPLVQNHLDSFDENGDYITADGGRYEVTSIVKIPAFTKETEGIVRALLPAIA